MNRNIFPVVIGEGRANDARQPRHLLPDPLDGQNAVHPRRHANIDERQQIGAAAGGRLDGHLQAFFALIGGIQRYSQQGTTARGLLADFGPEEGRFELLEP